MTFLGKLANNVLNFASKNQRVLLTSGTLIGLGITVYCVARDTAKAKEVLDNEKDMRKEELVEASDDVEKIEEVKIPVRDIVKSTWKCYIPSALAIAGTTTMVVSSCLLQGKREASLAAAYALSNRALTEMENKVKEEISDQKLDKIKGSIAQDQLAVADIPKSVVDRVPEGETLVFDSQTQQYFFSTTDKIKRVEAEMKVRLMNEMYISLNDLLYELGESKLGFGDDIGWSVNNGEELSIDIYYGTAHGAPCAILSYRVTTRYGYGDLH